MIRIGLELSSTCCWKQRSQMKCSILPHIIRTPCFTASRGPNSVQQIGHSPSRIVCPSSAATKCCSRSSRASLSLPMSSSFCLTTPLSRSISRRRLAISATSAASSLFRRGSALDGKNASHIPLNSAMQSRNVGRCLAPSIVLPAVQRRAKRPNRSASPSGHASPRRSTFVAMRQRSPPSTISSRIDAHNSLFPASPVSKSRNITPRLYISCIGPYRRGGLPLTYSGAPYPGVNIGPFPPKPVTVTTRCVNAPLTSSGFSRCTMVEIPQSISFGSKSRPRHTLADLISR